MTSSDYFCKYMLYRLERNVFDERSVVYLYVVNLCTELDGFGFLASDDGTYIMTVNAYNTVTDLTVFKHFLLLYKDFFDDGKTFLIILCISVRGSVLSMNFIALYEEFLKKSDHTTLKHLCS